MGSLLLNENEIRKIVEEKIKRKETLVTTQEILDSGIIPELKGFIVQTGKVSDSIYGGIGYRKENEEKIKFENPIFITVDGVPIRLMVRTERISTHDIGRGIIPFKDQVLAINHNYMLKLVRDIIGTSQFNIPGLQDNSVVIAAENLTQIPFENVIRAYNAESSTETSLYHAYTDKGERTFCGHSLPEGIIPNGKLPYIMDTPSTKSEEHDKSVDPAYLFEHKICTPQQYDCIKNASIAAFRAVSQFLRSKGLILVDTKTEHGITWLGEIVSQDELYTLDSSRFWLLLDYVKQLLKLERGEIKKLQPTSYSKEFARGFSEGKEPYTDEQRLEIAVRYIMSIQMITGERFIYDNRSYEERVVSGLQTAVKVLKYEKYDQLRYKRI